MAPEDASVPYKNLWVLKTDDMLKNLSWWWWWWLFFVKDPDNPGKTKQFMILWSTKYTDNIKVMDEKWSVSKLPTWEDGVLKFNGMTCAWWYDGKQMYDPLMIVKSDFEVRKEGPFGEVKPLVDGADYRFLGSPEKYEVNIKDDKNDFRFEMTPWNDYLQQHNFNESQYTKKYSYNILKIFGMKMNGRINGEEVTGSAYQQRVTVNAPAAPWYWGLVHFDDGSYLDYFMPFIGPQIFRTKEKAKSWLDWGDRALNRSIHFYHRESNTEFKFKKKQVTITHKVKDGLPIFDVLGKDKEKQIYLRLKAYSRAHWRFQQRRKRGMRSILYYNEFPAEVTHFHFKTRDGSVNVKKGDLGESAANFEHTWGKLI
jgi:hypothetical protein